MTLYIETVALLMDNCGPHGTDLRDTKQQIIILMLPSNSTAIPQIMDLGIIATSKPLHRSRILRASMGDFKFRQHLRAEILSLKGRMCILSEGFDPHLVNSAKTVKQG